MSYTPVVDTILTGNVRVPTVAQGTSDDRAASTQFVVDEIANELGNATGNFVDLTSAQTIGGAKTFSEPVVMTTANGSVESDTYGLTVKYDNGVSSIGIGANAGVNIVQNGNGQVFGSTAPGAAEFEFMMLRDGEMAWGTGAAPVDTFLRRSGVGELTVQANLAITGTPSSDGHVITRGYANDNYVDLTNAQDISGVKTFTAAPRFDTNSFPLGPAFEVTVGPDTTFSVGGTGDLTWYSNGSEYGGLRWNDVAHTLTLDSGMQLRLSDAPNHAQSAVNRAYVDSVASGLDAKQSVRVATTGNITLAGTQTIDGVGVMNGQRVLVKNQTTGSQNGIYVVAAGAWSRAADLDEPAELTGGVFVFVEEGTVNGDTGWVVTSNNPITLGTDPVVWTQFSASATISAGYGLEQTGNLFNVDTNVIPALATDNIFTGEQSFDNFLFANAGSTFNGDITFYDTIKSRRSTGTDLILDSIQSGDDYTRFAIGANGQHYYSDGTYDPLTSPPSFEFDNGAIKFTSQILLDNAYVYAEDGGAVELHSTNPDNPWTKMEAEGYRLYNDNGNANVYLLTGGGLAIDDAVGVQINTQSLQVSGEGTFSGQLSANIFIAGTAIHDSSNPTITVTPGTQNYLIELTDEVDFALPATHAAGESYTFKDTLGAAETYNFTISPDGAQTIDGQPNFVANINRMAVTVVSDGSNWHVV